MIKETQKVTKENNLIEELLELLSQSKLQDYNAAMKQINEYIQTNNESEAFRVRGILFYHTNNLDASLKDMEKAIELDPENAKAHNGIGCIYQHQENYKMALPHINKAIEYDQNYGGAYFNRGVVYDHLNENQKAIEDYTKAIELEPQRAQAYDCRGLIYKKLGRYDDALKDSYTALNMVPENPLYHTRIGVLSSILKDQIKCQYHLKKAQQYMLNDNLILLQKFNISEGVANYINVKIEELLE